MAHPPPPGGGSAGTKISEIGRVNVPGHRCVKFTHGSTPRSTNASFNRFQPFGRRHPPRRVAGHEPEDGRNAASRPAAGKPRGGGKTAEVRTLLETVAPWPRAE